MSTSLMKRTLLLTAASLIVFMFSYQAAQGIVSVRLTGGTGLSFPESGNLQVENETEFSGGAGVQLNLTNRLSANLDAEVQDIRVEGDAYEEVDEEYRERLDERYGIVTHPYGFDHTNARASAYLKFTNSFVDVVPPYDFRAKWEYFFIAGGYFSFAFEERELNDLRNVGWPTEDIEPAEKVFYEMSNFGTPLPVYDNIDFGALVGAGIQYNPWHFLSILVDVKYHQGLHNQAELPDEHQEAFYRKVNPNVFDLPEYNNFNRVISGNVSLQYHF